MVSEHSMVTGSHGPATWPGPVAGSKNQACPATRVYATKAAARPSAPNQNLGVRHGANSVLRMLAEPPIWSGGLALERLVSTAPN
jgi:hypothetical protein